jgi:hypothetical protein
MCLKDKVLNQILLLIINDNVQLKNTKKLKKFLCNCFANFKVIATT